MNEQQPIFTPEQFRVQAVELSQAVAELHRRDSKPIDPHDPFQNETEFHDYQGDYAEIVPQIRIPGCRIPLRPNSREKSKIRRCYNTVGGFLLGHMLLVNAMIFLLEELFLWLIRLSDSAAVGDLPANYFTLATKYLQNSSSLYAMNMLTLGVVNVSIFVLGCRLTKLKIPNFFRTTNLTFLDMFGYCTIAVFIQMTMSCAATGLTDLFKGVGIVLFDPNLGPLNDPKSILLSAIYGILVAPVTEELLMRGFVQKNLSRVSQHFGIIMTAFLFGLWHENVAQFVLAFVGGILFGYMDAKHNSLIPSIICHITINAFGEFGSICDDMGWDTALTILNCIYMGICLLGLVMLIRLLIVERFPHATPHQAERGLRQAFASPLLLCAIAAHIAFAVFMIHSASTK